MVQPSGEIQDGDSLKGELSSGTRVGVPNVPVVEGRVAVQMSVPPWAPPSVRVELQ
jgi:hypothetical protein